MEALNAFYKEHPALYTADYEPEGFAWTDTQDEQETVLAFVRRSMVSDSTSQDLLVIANFTPVVRKDFRMGVLEPGKYKDCLLYTSPSPRDGLLSRMPSSA